jgi:hypothetical protein
MKRFRTVAAAAAALAAVALAGSAAAAPPSSGGGTSILVTQTIVSARAAGGNTIVELDATRVLTGALSGVVTEHFRNVFHPNGVASVKGAGTFTGTLAGCGEEVLTMPFTVTGHVTPDGELSATFTSIGAAPAMFLGTANGPVTSPVLAYEALYHC